MSAYAILTGVAYNDILNICHKVTYLGVKMVRQYPNVRLEPRVYNVIDECSRKYGVGMGGAVTLMLLNDAVRNEFKTKIEQVIPERASRRRLPRVIEQSLSHPSQTAQ
jgi:hypothetical protein